MPNPISAVACADSYTDAATIGPLTMGSNGGYFTIATNDVFMRLGYKERQGVSEIRWMDEAHVPVGNGVFFKGTYAARFRNFVAGSVATVSGGLATPTQPLFTIAAGGVASGAVPNSVTGIIPATGTTPTAGGGFTYTHTNGTGLYTFTFNTAFGSIADVQVTLIGSSGTASLNAVPTTTGFVVTTGANDHPFTFYAVPTV